MASSVSEQNACENVIPGMTGQHQYLSKEQHQQYMPLNNAATHVDNSATGIERESLQSQEVLGPPELVNHEGDLSFGAMPVPQPPDNGLTKDGGFSFGSIMSVESAAMEKPTGLVAGPELSIGSLVLTDHEVALLAADNAARLQSNVREYEEEQHKGQQQQQSQRENHLGNEQSDNNNINYLNNLNYPNDAQRDDGGDCVCDMPTPVDLGLEPAGLSAGSMMSLGTTTSAMIPNQLDSGGLSFGSVMSLSSAVPAQGETGVAPVDGGLEEIGASFGSMTIASAAPTTNGTRTASTGTPITKSPPIEGHQSAPAFPSFTNDSTQRSKGNLLECSDTESEDEQDRERLKVQKSLDWEKLKEIFEKEMQGGAANKPPTFLSKASYGASTTTTPNARNTQQDQQGSPAINVAGRADVKTPNMLHIPETNFGRDISQMSAMSTHDNNNRNLNDNYSSGVLRSSLNDSNDCGDALAMHHQFKENYIVPPPPPPVTQLLKQGDDDDEWQTCEATLMASQQEYQKMVSKVGLLD